MERERKSSMDEKNQFNKLETSTDLENFLGSMKCKSPKKERYRHEGYYHYTTLDTMEKILKGDSLWLTSVSGFNDSMDMEQFEEKERYCFALCFSTERSENLPLWYLYSGMDGQGARLRLTPGKFKEMLENSSCKLVQVKQDGQNAKEPITLERGKNVEIELRDIIYAGDEKGRGAKRKYILKYGNIANRKVTKSEYEKYRSIHKGFHKGLLWQYEKESRLLAIVKGGAKELIDKEKPDKNTGYHIEIQLTKGVKQYMDICLAPNIVEERDKNKKEKNKTDIKTVCSENPEIRKYYESRKVQLSQYAGTVHIKQRNNKAGGESL